MAEKQIKFLIELEKLKGVERRSYPIGLDRRENSAEHSWSLAMAAMALAPVVVPQLDLLRILEMALVHDIVEIDAGDTFCYGDQKGKIEKERTAAQRIFGLLPADQAEQWSQLWEEFEARNTKESLFANSLDRILPLIQNFHGGGKTWLENGVRYEQVMERNLRIQDGSPELWEYARKLIDAAAARGWLPKG
jgi:putative hydrolase of HD superfamily